MANKWFETVAVAQRRAEKRLPKSVYGAIIGGAEKGLSLNGKVRLVVSARIRGQLQKAYEHTRKQKRRLLRQKTSTCRAAC